MDILHKIKKNMKQKKKYIKNIVINKFIIKYKNKKINLIDLNNNLLLSGECNFFGIYNENNKLWMWGNILYGIDKKTLKYIENIKKYHYLFENNDNPKYLFYYLFLTQNVVLIENNEMLKWINQLLLYLSNDLYYFNIKSNNLMEFITLNNIIEKYI